MACPAHGWIKNQLTGNRILHIHYIYHPTEMSNRKEIRHPRLTKIGFMAILLLMALAGAAQAPSRIDSLQNELNKAESDSVRIRTLLNCRWPINTF